MLKRVFGISIFAAALLSSGNVALAQAAPSPAPSASVSPAPGPTVDPAITAKAKDWLHRFQTGDIDRTQLASQMNAALTPDIIKQVEDELGPLGDPQSFKIVSEQSLPDEIVYVYRVTFKSSSIDEIIGLDKSGKISGFRLTPVP